MSIEYLKSAKAHNGDTMVDVSATVAGMLERLQAERETAALEYARDLDGWDRNIEVSADDIAAATAQTPDDLKAAIQYAHDNIRHFAEAQRASAQDFEIELRPGVFAGQKQLPLHAAGCYVPGGRYAHIASALMSVTTARVAGVADITACSPPHTGKGIPAAVIYAMSLAGADRILTIGGVQGVAAMAQGLFGAAPADILVGPGNSYVAEAKRQLFGPAGIDMFAGPTDVLIVADDSADPRTVAWDLAGQAEHGDTSPAWLVATDRDLATEVLRLIPGCIAELPEPNASAAATAWANLGEVVVCTTREEAVQMANQYAPEHLHVQARDTDWWRDHLSAYGSLFLGAGTCVAFGDKAAGPNHVLPTSRTARYTGGLSVHKFLKTVTWQQVGDGAGHDLARATAVISRAEGMEGHARTADLRLTQPATDAKLAPSLS